MRCVVLVLFSLLFAMPTAAQTPSKNAVYFGQCSPHSHIARGGITEDLTKKQSRYFCNKAIISSLNSPTDTHMMIQFLDKKVDAPLGVAGWTEAGLLRVDRLYLEGKSPVSVDDGSCRLFFKKDTLTDIVCGATIAEKGRKTVAVIEFAVSSQPPTPGEWAEVQDVGPYQGAVVCADLETVNAFTRLRLEYQEDLFRARMTGGQSALIRSIPDQPRAENYGCTVLPAGTWVLADFSNIIPIVKAKIGNHEVVGVTDPAFLKR